MLCQSGDVRRLNCFVPCVNEVSKFLFQRSVRSLPRERNWGILSSGIDNPGLNAFIFSMLAILSRWDTKTSNTDETLDPELFIKTCAQLGEDSLAIAPSVGEEIDLIKRSMRNPEGRATVNYPLRLLIITFLCLPTWAQKTFDLSEDFSLQNNPNHVWQYGYSATNSLAPDQFRLDKYCDGGSPVAFWHPEASQAPGPGYYPYVAYNTTKQTQSWPSPNGWIVRGGEIAMEASNSGQYSMVRFVAPVGGAYKITAQFEGIHVWSTTDVHVLHNATSLFDADIDGYGGDPAFRKVHGASPSAEYSGQIERIADDTVTFAVEYGKNKTNSGDTTGLFAKVILLGEGATASKSEIRGSTPFTQRDPIGVQIPHCPGSLRVQNSHNLLESSSPSIEPRGQRPARVVANPYPT